MIDIGLPYKLNRAIEVTLSHKSRYTVFNIYDVQR